MNGAGIAISFTTAVVCLVAGGFLFQPDKKVGRNRAALILFVVGGFGLMAGPVGTAVFKGSQVVTHFIQGLTDSRDLAQAVPTLVAVAACFFVIGAILSGNGSMLAAVIAVALPTLLFHVDGQFADAAHVVLDSIQSLITAVTEGFQGGVKELR
jgi:hypothetical protein